MGRADRSTLEGRILARDQLGRPSPSARGERLLFELLLPRVQRVYGRAARPTDHGTERWVHGIRVASRKLVEALCLVAPICRSRRLARAVRRAKRLRRALGRSRESEVFVREFRRVTQEAGLPASIVQALDTFRTGGSQHLEVIQRQYSSTRLLRHGADILHLARQTPSEVPFFALSSRHLYARHLAVEPLVSSIEDEALWPEHHRLRNKFKSLRYSLEVLDKTFRDVIDSRSLIARLKRLQDDLGALNDAQDLLDGLDRLRPERIIAPATLTEVRRYADAERRRRYQIARPRVLAEAPILLGDVRRAAGIIGPIDV